MTATREREVVAVFIDGALHVDDVPLLSLKDEFVKASNDTQDNADFFDAS